MRKRLLQLLPEIGVTSVPSVPEREKPWKQSTSGEDTSGTLPAKCGVTGVPAAPGKAVHPVHQRKNDVCQEKPNEISVGTPVTPGTPIFSQDFIEAYEERAAIMQFDGDMPRAQAETAALEDCKIIWLSRYGRPHKNG